MPPSGFAQLRAASRAFARGFGQLRASPETARKHPDAARDREKRFGAGLGSIQLAQRSAGPWLLDAWAPPGYLAPPFL
eukprot:2887061-Alexandrium_andersonii.AAC.1